MGPASIADATDLPEAYIPFAARCGKDAAKHTVDNLSQGRQYIGAAMENGRPWTLKRQQPRLAERTPHSRRCATRADLCTVKFQQPRLGLCSRRLLP